MAKPGTQPSSSLVEDPAYALQEVRLCDPRRGDLARRYLAAERFFEHHLKIKDKETGEIRRFKLWPAQKDVLRLLVSGSWLYIIKARQLGITWLVGGYILWKMLYWRFYTAVVINQGKDYAEEFCEDKIKFMYGELPVFFQIPLKNETKQSLKFGNNGIYDLDSNLQAIAGNKKSGRSFTGNVLFADEAAYIEFYGETFRGAEPTLKNTKGQAIVLSSSDGPKGLFHDQWKRIKPAGISDEPRFFDGTQIYREKRWTGIFLPWDANPNRDEQWYEDEKEAHSHDPNYMRREFPCTPDEAFEAAGGRVYPAFKNKPKSEGGHIHRFKPSELNDLWPRYRAVDPGESRSAFVCLWLVEIPSDRPQFTVDPSCVNFIKEMLGYSYKDDGSDEPMKIDDHGMDAIRYAVATFGLEKWVHIYREMYIYDAVGKGHTTGSVCAMIREMSGWEMNGGSISILRDGPVVYSPDEGVTWSETDWVESYEGTVYDRARASMCNEFDLQDIDAEPHRPPDGEKLDKVQEKTEGRAMVNKLVASTLPLTWEREKTEEDYAKERVQGERLLASVGVRAIKPLGRKLKDNAAKRRKRRPVSSSGGRHPYFGSRY